MAVNAAQMVHYLKGINFPADKQKIISTAEANGAPEEVMLLLNKLPQKEYDRANEIEQEFSKMV